MMARPIGPHGNDFYVILVFMMRLMTLPKPDLNPITGGRGGGRIGPPASFSALYGKRQKMGT